MSVKFQIFKVNIYIDGEYTVSHRVYDLELINDIISGLWPEISRLTYCWKSENLHMFLKEDQEIKNTDSEISFKEYTHPNVPLTSRPIHPALHNNLPPISLRTSKFQYLFRCW